MSAVSTTPPAALSVAYLCPPVLCSALNWLMAERGWLSTGKGVIGHIRDQGMSTCGSCFVFGPVTALEDKWCISHGGNSTWGTTSVGLLSVQDALACGNAGSCSGGNPMAVMGYLNSVGVVSGGDYGESDQLTCLPYAVPPNGAVPPLVCPGTGAAGNCSESKLKRT